MNKLLILIPVLVLSLVLALSQDADAQQNAVTITRTAFGNITWETFDAPMTDTSVWDKGLPTNNGELNLSANQNISTRTQRGKPVVMELRAKFEPSDTPRLGFFTLANPDSNHAMFKGVGNNKAQASAKGSGGTFTGPDLTGVNSFNIYKIYRADDKIQFWRNGAENSNATITYTDPQAAIVMADGTTNALFVDWVSVYKDNIIKVRGLSPGQKIQLLDRSGQVKAEDTVGPGETISIMDTGGASFPLNGSIKVFSSTGSLVKEQQFDLIFGGDEFTVSGAGTYTLELRRGLNLISSPIEGGIPLTTIESSCTLREIGAQGGTTNKAWAWKSGEGWENPTIVSAGRGVWISTTADCSVTVSGTPFNGTISLGQGLNLIGTNGDVNRIDNTCGGKFIEIGAPEGIKRKFWTWNEGWNNPDPPVLDPRKGAWVSVTEACSFRNDCSINDASSCPTGKDACTDMVAPQGKVWCR